MRRFNRTRCYSGTDDPERGEVRGTRIRHRIHR